MQIGQENMTSSQWQIKLQITLIGQYFNILEKHATDYIDRTKFFNMMENHATEYKERTIFNHDGND